MIAPFDSKTLDIGQHIIERLDCLPGLQGVDRCLYPLNMERLITVVNTF